MTVSTLLSGLAVVSVDFEAPVAAALFGAATLFWSTPSRPISNGWPKGGGRRQAHSRGVFARAAPAHGSPSEPRQSQWIRLPLSTCHRHAGLRKADAGEWPLQRARALPWLVALRLQQLRHEALRPSTYPSELQYRTGLVPALGTHIAACVRR